MPGPGSDYVGRVSVGIWSDLYSPRSALSSRAPRVGPGSSIRMSACCMCLCVDLTCAFMWWASLVLLCITEIAMTRLSLAPARTVALLNLSLSTFELPFSFCHTKACRTSVMQELTTGSVLSYIVSTKHDLGHVFFLRVWHDDSGPGQHASWYLSRVVLEDLQSGQRSVTSFWCVTFRYLFLPF